MPLSIVLPTYVICSGYSPSDEHLRMGNRTTSAANPNTVSTSYVIDDEHSETRKKLTKRGQNLLNDFLSTHIGPEHSESTQKYIEGLLGEHSRTEILFIKFEDFIGLGSFPRYPDNANIVQRIEDIEGQRDKSLMIFISHCWLRGESTSKGWDGRAHPDNIAGDKFKLCVEGIKRLKAIYASRMQNCYVWMDYSCTNQNKESISSAFGEYDKIVQLCDCIFTPVVDHHHNKWDHPLSISDLFCDYKAEAWNSGDRTYLSRGWARLEMIYGANIPVMDNKNGVKRHTLFDQALAYHCSQNRRPHFLYGTKEHVEGMAPCVLPPLSRSFMTEYHPTAGNFSVESDLYLMPELMSDLEPYLPPMEAQLLSTGIKNWEKKVRYDESGGYVGALRSGVKHGKGVYQYFSGEVYEGKFRDDVKHGKGKLRYTNGSVYEGEWRYDRKDGHGSLRYPDGGLYVGEWLGDERSGSGVYTYADGSVYNGEWSHDKRDGEGSYAYWYFATDSTSICSGTGDVGQEQCSVVSVPVKVTYEGAWEENKRCGYGALTFPSGAVYSGMWSNDLRHGHGSFKDADGTVTEGEWNCDRRLT